MDESKSCAKYIPSLKFTMHCSQALVHIKIDIQAFLRLRRALLLTFFFVSFQQLNIGYFHYV